MKKITQKMMLMGLMFSLVSCAEKEAKKINLPTNEAQIPVKITIIKVTDFSSKISTTGLLSTENTVTYSFKISGIIDHIFVLEGQYFKKGQLLAKLKATEITAQLTQAKLAVEKAKRDYTRTKNLYQDSVATLEQLQNAKTGLDLAQQGLDAVTFNNRYSSIYAQNDGFVGKKLANDGEVVNAGTPILMINETSRKDNWILKCGLTDKDWSVIKTGDEAIVKLDAFPQVTFSGVVSRKSQVADQNGGTFQIDILLKLDQQKVAAGMFGQAQIQNKNSQSYIKIPYDAVIEADGDQAFVYVPTAGHHVKKIPITIQNYTNKEVWVSKGLEDVSAVINSNSAFLNENSLITIIK